MGESRRGKLLTQEDVGTKVDRRTHPRPGRGSEGTGQSLDGRRPKGWPKLMWTLLYQLLLCSLQILSPA